MTAEVPCRTRFSFGMSGDGKKLYLFGAGFEIEVYDAATLKHERTWDLGGLEGIEKVATVLPGCPPHRFQR